MNQNWIFFYYLMFHSLFIQGDIVYIGSLNQTDIDMQENFYKNFYQIDKVTDIRILTNNMHFVLNETAKIRKDLSLISLGMNNSLIIEECSLLIENTIFEVKGFSLNLKSLNTQNFIFMVSRNGSLILEVKNIKLLCKLFIFFNNFRV